jgi:hypothetical protein
MAAGCMAITLEVSENKWRPEADLAAIWEENGEALVEYAATAALAGGFGMVVGWEEPQNTLHPQLPPLPPPHTQPPKPHKHIGVRGTVLSAAGSKPLNATLTIKPADASLKPIPFRSDPKTGFYARPLAPGKHTVVAVAEGYASTEQVVDVANDGKGVVQNFLLRLEGGSSSDSGSSDAAEAEAPEPTSSSSNSSSSAGSSSSSSSGGGGSSSGSSPPSAAEAAARFRTSLHILAVHGAVFLALSGASLCQSSGLLHALVGSRMKRLGSGSRFSV